MKLSRAFTPLLLAFFLVASPARADRDLVPSMQQSFDVCSDRPAEPAWMQNIALREAYQRVLVQDIYRSQNLERIVRTGSCACAIRFPSWDEAEATFRADHTGADRWEMLKALDQYNRRANEMRTEAKSICEAEGNW